MERIAAGERPEFSEFEIPDWARKMAGPWAKKRDFLDETHDRTRWAFVDLADPAKDGPKVEWLIEGLLPSRYLAVLGGDSKSGKTWFVTALALSIATGTDFMGLNTVKRPVVWLSFEENETERQLAFDGWFASGGARPEKWHFMTSYQRLYIDDPVGLRVVGETLYGSQSGLLVIDPLHASYGAGSISDGSTARRVLAGLKQLCRDMNMSVLVIHHLTKQVGSGLVRERMADSAQILAAASMDWLMEVGEGVVCRAPIADSRPDTESDFTQRREEDTKDAKKGNDCGRVMRLIGRGRGAEVNRNWLIESSSPMVYRLIGDGNAPLRSGLERRVLELLGDGSATSRLLSDGTGAPIGSVRNLLTRLMSRGEIRIVMINGRERLYGLS